MKKTTLTSLSIVLAAGLLVGCGGGGGGINSGVDQAKPASEVTDDEAEDICQATADYAASKVNEQEIGCRTTGLAAGIGAILDGDDAMQEACTEAYDDCMADEPEAPAETNCDGATASVADCEDSVTVGEVETCLQDRVDGGVAAVDTLPSCSELTVEYLQDLAENPPEEPEQPESCDAVYDGCPGFAM